MAATYENKGPGRWLITGTQHGDRARIAHTGSEKDVFFQCGELERLARLAGVSLPAYIRELKAKQKASALAPKPTVWPRLRAALPPSSMSRWRSARGLGKPPSAIAGPFECTRMTSN